MEKSGRVGSAIGGFHTNTNALSTVYRNYICAHETTRQLPAGHIELHRQMSKLRREGYLQNNSEADLASKEVGGLFDFPQLVSAVDGERRFLVTNNPVALPKFEEEWGILKKNEDRVRNYVEKSIKLADQKAMKLHYAKKENIGVEIMQEFVVDMLGRDTIEAKIFLRKTEEDFRHLNLVGNCGKLIAWLLVLGLNAFFLYYLIELGINKPPDFQLNFVTVCMIQLLLEMVFFETIEVFFVQYFIPHSVLEVVRDKIEELRTLASGMMDDFVGPRILNAAEFLFVSNRLARKFPTLFESEIVHLYSSYLPGGISSSWNRSWNLFPDNLSHYRGARLLLPTLAILQCIGTLNMREQKVLVRLIVPVLILLGMLSFIIPLVVLVLFLLCHFFVLKRRQVTVIHVEEPTNISRPSSVENRQVQALLGAIEQENEAIDSNLAIGTSSHRETQGEDNLDNGNVSVTAEVVKKLSFETSVVDHDDVKEGQQGKNDNIASVKFKKKKSLGAYELENDAVEEAPDDNNEAMNLQSLSNVSFKANENADR